MSNGANVVMNDYVDAAERHYFSGQNLYETCKASASHCYGISVECVLKAFMSNLQPQRDPITKRHLGITLWSEFETHPHLATKSVLIEQAKQFQDCFCSWEISQRYWNRADAVFNSEIVEQQQKGAKALIGILQQVQQGLL